MFSPKGRSHVADVTVGDRRNNGTGEELATTPRDQAFSRKEGEVRWEREGAAALCGDGKTHQVCDRSRTDGCCPELPDVRVMGREAGRCRVPCDRSYLRSSGGGWADGVCGKNGDARRWREVPGTGGRTSTVSRNSSGRHRD